MNKHYFESFLENECKRLSGFSQDSDALKDIYVDYQTKLSRWQQQEQTLNICQRRPKTDPLWLISPIEK